MKSNGAHAALVSPKEKHDTAFIGIHNEKTGPIDEPKQKHNYTNDNVKDAHNWVGLNRRD